MKKMFLLLLSICLSFATMSSICCSSPASAAKTFPDVAADWQVAAVTNAVAAGYVDGYPDGTFQPDRSVSRAEFMTMLVKALKFPLILGTNDAWYIPYEASLQKSFIYRADDFSADAVEEPMTRQEMINLAYRAVHPELQKESILMDNKSLVYNAVKAGIVQGLGKGALGLDETTTRAQAVVIIDRLLQLKAGKKLDTVDKNALSVAEVDLMGSNFWSRFGVKTVELPLHITTHTSQEVDIQQMIFIDPNDPDDPYFNKIPPLFVGWDNNLSDMYLLAIKYHVENPHYADLDGIGLGIWNFDYGIQVDSGWILAGSKPGSDSTGYEFQLGKTFKINQEPVGNQQDGYQLLFQPREQLDQYLSSGGKEYITLRSGGKSYRTAILPTEK